MGTHINWRGAVISEPKQLVGKTLCVWGAGLEGQALLRYLRNKLGIKQNITVIDQSLDNDLASMLRQKYGAIDCRNDPSGTHCEVVLRSPAISPYSAGWKKLIAGQTPPDVSSCTVLWLGDTSRRAKTVAITGSKGKTTSATLLYNALQSLGAQVNIGGNSTHTPLLDMAEAQMNIAEISSFQAVELDAHLRPMATLLTNLYSAHTDWHGGYEQYIQDKLKLCAWREHTLTLCNAQDTLTRKYLGAAKHVLWYGTEDGMHLRNERFYYRDKLIGQLDNPCLQTAHALGNVCGVLAMLMALADTAQTANLLKNMDWALVFEALNAFQGIPHRQEYIGTYHDHHYVDDSAATIPEATLAALRAHRLRYKQAMTVLIGGQQHTQDYTALVRELRTMSDIRIVLLPDNGAYLAGLIEKAAPANTAMPAMFVAEDLQDGMRWAQQHTPKEGLILLSPAAPSIGCFTNYMERGARFCELAIG